MPLFTALLMAQCIGLLDALIPLRQMLQAFLTDGDAARVWRVGRSAAISLLYGFTFTRHLFRFVGDGRRCTALRERVALLERYGLRMTRIQLEGDLGICSLLDGATGRSLLPSSLLALSCGHDEDDDAWGEELLARPVDDQQLRQRKAWDDLNLHPSSADWIPAWHGWYRRVCGQSQSMSSHPAQTLTPLLPAELPSSLRVLQLYDRALQPGSLPPSLTALQASGNVRPLSAAVLPDTLTYLDLSRWVGDLEPGMLPPSLRTLLAPELGSELQLGMLPPNLTALTMMSPCSHVVPQHVMPSSLRFLRLRSFDQSFAPGALPHALEYLDLGQYLWGLTIGVLPSSLRVLCFCGYWHQLRAGVIPEGVIAIDLAEHTGELLESSCFPDTTEWLRLVWSEIGRVSSCSVARDVIPAGLRWLVVERRQWRTGKPRNATGPLCDWLTLPARTVVVEQEGEEAELSAEDEEVEEEGKEHEDHDEEAEVGGSEMQH